VYERSPVKFSTGRSEYHHCPAVLPQGTYTIWILELFQWHFMNHLLHLQKFLWTTHAKVKMSYYGLSESRVKRVLRSPARTEEGIAPKTIAYMQPASIKTKGNEKKWSQEIWVMAQNSKKGDIKVISSWRYPGMSKARAPLPAEVRMEIEEAMEEMSND
jgi:hypothetical protein